MNYNHGCHKETPCIAILYKQKNVLFFTKTEKEGITSLVWEVGTSGMANMVEIMYSHACKWENENC
jgi:hypothetical protein